MSFEKKGLDRTLPRHAQVRKLVCIFPFIFNFNFSIYISKYFKNKYEKYLLYNLSKQPLKETKKLAPFIK